MQNNLNGDLGYRTDLKPYVARLLSAVGLDVIYHRAAGDTLYYTDATGNERAVLDMVGGFGAGLLGHNHPALVACAQQVLTEQRPFLSQASIRTAAGALAHRLAAIAQQETGRAFVVTLANSGAEVVEAGLKHAEMRRQERLQEFRKAMQRGLRSARLAQSEGRLQIPPHFFAQAAAQLGVAEINNLGELGQALVHYNERQLTAAPIVLAVVGSFHGKTTGAVKLTHSAEFRVPWHSFGLHGEFVARNDEAHLRQISQLAQVTCYQLALDDAGWLQWHECKLSRLVACLAEPIQGEGGIHELTPVFLQSLRTLADETQAALIFDEIQSGMGRTGSFFAATPSGVVGDYYLLSKTLGGALAKEAALLIRRDHYIERFGYLHSSTFAEDDFSAAIALTTLDLLQADDWALMQACRRKGDDLLQRLHHLQAAYPQVIRQVRGRGLMIGIELTPQLESPANLLRVASEQNLLGFLISGYLLHEAAIRIAPTLSANNTIRLEPSALISAGAIDHFCTAFATAVAAIDRADAYALTRHIAGEGTNTPAAMPATPAAPQRPAAKRALRRVACVAHFIQPEDIRHWDPSLAALTPAGCDRLLQRSSRVFDPFIADECTIEGAWGERVQLAVVGLPMSAAQLMARVRQGEAPAVLAEIEMAVELAKGWGATMIGFAGYTSIVTNNCLALVEDEVGLTSGNSLTAAAALGATQQVAAQLGLAWAQVHLGILGGVGNIGRVISEIEAAQVQALTLFGRNGSESRLQRLATTLQQSGATAHLQVSTDLAHLQACNVIISASNAPEPLITPAHLNAHPTVICDVAVPGDVTAGLAQQMPQVRVLKGGILQLPGNQEVTIRGMALAQGDAYACIAEVILLGLAGIRQHFSYGALQAERVQQIGALARQYGFTVRVREGE